MLSLLILILLGFFTSVFCAGQAKKSRERFLHLYRLISQPEFNCINGKTLSSAKTLLNRLMKSTIRVSEKDRHSVLLLPRVKFVVFIHFV